MGNSSTAGWAEMEVDQALCESLSRREEETEYRSGAGPLWSLGAYLLAMRCFILWSWHGVVPCMCWWNWMTCCFYLLDPATKWAKEALSRYKNSSTTKSSHLRQITDNLWTNKRGAATSHCKAAKVGLVVCLPIQHWIPRLAHANADGLSKLSLKQKAAAGNPPVLSVFNV